MMHKRNLLRLFASALAALVAPRSAVAAGKLSRREVMIQNCDFWPAILEAKDHHERYMYSIAARDDDGKWVANEHIRNLIIGDFQATKDLLQGNEEWPA
jgi:hypothetical protein